MNSFSEFYINNSTSLPAPYEITADLSVTSDYNGPDNDTLIAAPLITTQYWARAEGTCNTTAMVTTIVTINPLPGKPATPTGADTLCQNAVNTDYTTTGASGATSYIWSIDPPAAGTISGTGTTGTVDWLTTFMVVFRLL